MTNTNKNNNWRSTEEMEEELKVLTSVVESIESQVNSFHLFHGDNPQLDMLLQNVSLIFKRRNCSSSASNCNSKAGAGTAGYRRKPKCGINNAEVVKIRVPDPDHHVSPSRRIVSSPNSVIGNSTSTSSRTVVTTVATLNNDCSNLDLEILQDDNDEHIRRLEANVKQLRELLNQLKLHVSGFKIFAKDSPGLQLFMQNLDFIITRYSEHLLAAPGPSHTQQAQTTTYTNTSCSNNAGSFSTDLDVTEISEAQTDITCSDLQLSNSLPSCSKAKSSSNLNSKRKLESTEEASTEKGMDENAESLSKKLKSTTATTDADDDIADADITTISTSSAAADADSSGLLSVKEESEKPLTPQQKVFSTDLTMIKILSHLSIVQLKNFRRLNWRFNIYATQALRNHDSFKVNFKYDLTTKSYLNTTTRTRAQMSGLVPLNLKMFTRFIKTCSDFPCEYFSFTNGSLNSEDLQEFLDSCGGIVKRIHIDLFCLPSFAAGENNNNHHIGEAQAQAQDAHEQQHNEYPPIFLLKKLLVHQLPNLQSLELEHFPKSWTPSFDRLFPEPKGKEVVLNKIKSLKLPSNTPTKIVEDLLSACVNLTEVRSYSNFLPLFNANKFHLMKILSWQPNPAHGPEDIVNINIDEIPVSKLERFGICLDRVSSDPAFLERVSRILMNLLESSKDSIHRMCFATPIGFLPGLKIPQLAKVKTIKIGGVADLPNAVPVPVPGPGPFPGGGHIIQENNFSKKYFPQGFQLGSTFPNLCHIVFEFRHVTKTERWESLFENYKSVPTVKSLDICDKCKYLPVEWMVKFVHLFPNVESLNIQAKFFHFPHDARGIWSFTKLKALRLRINVTAPHNQFPALDGAFTGFTEQTCLNLRDNSHSVDIANVMEMRENPSIVLLKGLRSLRLTFVDPLSAPRIRDLPPVITHISGLFAFQMCKHLRVSVDAKASFKENSIRLMNALSPIFPYVRSHKLV